jgi:hypothetical protein
MNLTSIAVFSMAFVLACGLRAVSAQAQSDDDLQAFMQSLERRRASTKTVLYEAAGEKLLASEFIEGAPEHTSPLKTTVKIDFARNWVLHELDCANFFPTIKQYLPRAERVVYDGVVAKRFHPYDAATRAQVGLSNHQADATVSTPNEQSWLTAFSFTDEAVLVHHGYVLPKGKGTRLVQKIGLFASAKDLQKNRRAELDGVACAVFSQEIVKTARHEYWVDPKRDYCCLRIDKLVGSNLRARLDIVPKKAAWGWVPDSWEATYYGGHGKLIFVDRQRVTKLRINETFAKSDFQEPVAPGSIVKDNDNKSYWKAGAGGQLMPFDPDAELPAEDSSSWKWLAMLVVAVSVLAIGYRWMKHRSA